MYSTVDKNTRAVPQSIQIVKFSIDTHIRIYHHTHIKVEKSKIKIMTIIILERKMENPYRISVKSSREELKIPCYLCLTPLKMQHLKFS